MMELTPLDVRKKKEDFKRAVRGYDPAQVDGFLDLVADRLEDLVGRELRLREQADLLREHLAAFQSRERALNDALVTAQELREEARAQAEKAAELHVREAERQAEAIRREAELAVHGSRRGLEDLRIRRSGFLRSLRSTVERFLVDLEEEERRLEQEDEEMERPLRRPPSDAPAGPLDGQRFAAGEPDLAADPERPEPDSGASDSPAHGPEDRASLA